MSLVGREEIGAQVSWPLEACTYLRKPAYTEQQLNRANSSDIGAPFF